MCILRVNTGIVMLIKYIKYIKYTRKYTCTSIMHWKQSLFISNTTGSSVSQEIDELGYGIVGVFFGVIHVFHFI